MGRVRVFIVGHHRLFCDGLRAVLDRQRRVQVVGVATDEPSALDEVRKARPDVLIVDGNVESLSVERLLETTDTSIRVIHLTLEDNRVSVFSRELIENVTAERLVAAVLEQPPKRTPSTQNGLAPRPDPPGAAGN